MSFSHTLSKSVTGGVTPGLTSSITKTGGSAPNLSEPIPASSIELLVVFALDVSAVKLFVMQSDQDCTVKTNSSGAPANTITLEAGIPYDWHEDEPDAFQLDTDVTALYVTDDSGGNDAMLEIRSITDPTP